MLARCCNPSSAHPFRYLSDAKLFRLENDPALRQYNPTKEYFWLCPSISLTMTLCISPEGEVIPVALAEPSRGSNRLSTDRQKELLLSDVLVQPKDIGKVERRALHKQKGGVTDGEVICSTRVGVRQFGSSDAVLPLQLCFWSLVKLFALAKLRVHGSPHPMHFQKKMP